MKKSMLFIISLIVLFLMSWGCNKHKSPTAVSGTIISPTATNTPEISCTGVITFPDANLKAAVRDAIGKPTGDIYASDLDGLTSLDASSRNIVDLTGLQCCANLTELRLYRNSISDISALSGLTNLTELELWGNSINDISALSGLTNLTLLWLESNNISDINALSGLTNLTVLSLNDNSISDISALRTNCDAGGLGNGDEVGLHSNPLSTQATDVDIPYLESNGVKVGY